MLYEGGENEKDKRGLGSRCQDVQKIAGSDRKGSVDELGIEGMISCNEKDEKVLAHHCTKLLAPLYTWRRAPPAYHT